MAKYVVMRKDVCAGLLYKHDNSQFKIYNDNNKEVSLPASDGNPCRGMLFRVNILGLAKDLIYTTPTFYPIEGVTSNIPSQNEFLVGNYTKLGELLEY